MQKQIGAGGISLSNGIGQEFFIPFAEFKRDGNSFEAGCLQIQAGFRLLVDLNGFGLTAFAYPGKQKNIQQQANGRQGTKDD